jgi:aminoglycoside phosphotransferase (APT) family kinase protein
MRKLHADEVATDASLARRLVAAQFPQWADLEVEPVDENGTENATFRLGDELSVRLPRGPRRGVGQVDKDLRWLPMLAPLLPLAVPAPIAKGMPAEGYPFEWAVYGWLPGEPATPDRIADPTRAATDMAGFLAALQRVDTTGGPAGGRPNTSRGIPVRLRDEQTREAIAALGGEVDVDAVTKIWERALRAPDWDGLPVWVHGDLIPGNLLASDGRLSAVIDFAALCVGDPSNDVMVAWTFLAAETRAAFRDELGVDDATWARGRGWALSWALIALPYYLHTHPPIVRDARRTIDEVLADPESAWYGPGPGKT